VHSGVFYISERWRGPPNVTGTRDSLPPYPTLLKGLRVTQCLWLCSCSPSDHAVLAGWSILQSVVCRAFAGLQTAGDVCNNW